MQLAEPFRLDKSSANGAASLPGSYESRAVGARANAERNFQLVEVKWSIMTTQGSVPSRLLNSWKIVEARGRSKRPLGEQPPPKPL